MNQRHLKAAIRAVGTIAGLFGILLLLSAVGFVIPNLAGKGVADPGPFSGLAQFFSESGFTLLRSGWFFRIGDSICVVRPT
jgi:hypothetical protein